jgi:hypothetical protein
MQFNIGVVSRSLKADGFSCNGTPVTSATVFRVLFACFSRVFCLANAYIRSQSLLILVEDISWRLNFVAQIAGKSTQL